ncbi:MAG TPA: hypothetical protein VH475_20280 [Tepidisphaeraceae bacterium]
MGILVFAAAAPAAETAKAPGAEVRYGGLGPEQAAALAQTISAAREVYAKELGFDMPETIVLNVECGPNVRTRLFNDGKDRLVLSIASPDSLARPSKSGTFHLYGLCHELGHLAMYRTLKDRDWLTGAGAEGWAHYVGSVVVDRVYAQKGEKLWADPYDYRADGTARLKKQLAAASPDEVVKAAGKWEELADIVGLQEMPKVFAKWQGVGIDPALASKRLVDVAEEFAPDAGKKAALAKWWTSAAPLLVRDRPASEFKRVELPVAKLENKPLELNFDDGTADGKRSIAGGGHARLFEAPGGGEWYLRSVQVHGARYGPVAAPADQFDVALCDADMKPIAVWKQPYRSFARGVAGWVKIQTPPTRVPAKFNVCLAFRPTARNGVLVSYDASTQGASRVATPGNAGAALGQGDWMIRVELDRAKGADALRGEE